MRYARGIFSRKNLDYSELWAHPAVREILDHPEYQRLAEFRHHGSTTCLAHCMEVAIIGYAAARRWGLDCISTARGALLHDFFLYDWRSDGPRLHGFRHPRIALQNASAYFSINEIERDIILRHMWPLTPLPPRYAESFIVSNVDKAAAIRDYRRLLRRRAS